jgi:hypothetical protein
MGWDRTIPQIRLFGSGSRVGTRLFSVVPCCPSKLEGRERTSGDNPVLAVPQPNTPSWGGVPVLRWGRCLDAAVYMLALPAGCAGRFHFVSVASLPVPVRVGDGDE